MKSDIAFSSRNGNTDVEAVVAWGEGYIVSSTGSLIKSIGVRVFRDEWVMAVAGPIEEPEASPGAESLAELSRN
jgi:hypothetical protein